MTENKKVKPNRPMCTEGDEFVTPEGEKITIGYNEFASYTCKCGKTFKKLIARKSDGLVYLPEHAQMAKKVIETKAVAQETIEPSKDQKKEAQAEVVKEEKPKKAPAKKKTTRKPKAESKS